ncbi:hypothetical protein NL154_15355 [Rhizobium sp. YTUHZ044]|uniref:hypothetical protein n=1 Tax=Rhizobium sp. YTUHZ044 TaxID=2962678 RepID=UPI003DAA003E
MSIQQSFQKTRIYFNPGPRMPVYAITEAARSAATSRGIAERCGGILGWNAVEALSANLSRFS